IRASLGEVLQNLNLVGGIGGFPVGVRQLQVCLRLVRDSLDIAAQRLDPLLILFGRDEVGAEWQKDGCRVRKTAPSLLQNLGGIPEPAGLFENEGKREIRVLLRRIQTDR